MAENLPELEKLFTVAKTFVEQHYTTSGGTANFLVEKDKNIKILATMNQLIELKKSAMPEIEWVRGDEALASDMVPIKKREQKGQ